MHHIIGMVTESEARTQSAETVVAPEEAERLLAPYKWRLALPKQDYIDLYRRQKDPNLDEYQAGLLDTLPAAPLEPEEAAAGWQTYLSGIFAVIRDRLCEDKTFYADGRIHWGQLALAVLPESGEQDRDDQVFRDKCLGAIACTLFAAEDEDRLAFIAEVYRRGLQGDMAGICWENELTVIEVPPPADTEYRTTRANNFADVFKGTQDDIQAYSNYVADGATAAERAAAKQPKLWQRRLAAVYAGRNVATAMLEEAEEQSRAATRPSRFIVDPYKIERFALQQVFMEAQMNELFYGDNLADSPLALALENRRKPSAGQKFSMDDPLPRHFDNLLFDTIASVEEITAPVIERFRPPDAAGPPVLISTEQRAALRFQEVNRRGAQFRNFAKFVDRSRRVLPLARSFEIWSVAERGADAPQRAVFLLHFLVRQGLAMKADAGQAAGEEELWHLAHRHRPSLIRLANLNINDFRLLLAPSPQAAFNDRLQADAPRLTRQPDGRLELAWPSMHEDLSSASDYHEGATLGCPALRLKKEQLSHEAARTINYIDYIVSVVIDEARGRGILDLDNYGEGC